MNRPVSKISLVVEAQLTERKVGFVFVVPRLILVVCLTPKWWLVKVTRKVRTGNGSRSGCTFDNS